MSGWTMVGLRRGTIAAAGVLLSLMPLGMAGCGMQLETGYTYRPLNSTDAQRRAYYASPFSPEKSAADKDKGGGNAGPGLGTGAVREPVWQEQVVPFARRWGRWTRRFPRRSRENRPDRGLQFGQDHGVQTDRS